MSEEVAGKAGDQDAREDRPAIVAAVDAGIAASGETQEALEASAESQMTLASAESQQGATSAGGASGAPKAPETSAEGGQQRSGGRGKKGGGRFPRGDRDERQEGEGFHAAAQPEAAAPMGRRLRRMMDADMDAELEAALGDFDGKSLLSSEATGQATQESAPPAPSRGKHAEPSHDKRTVRVLSVRGDDVFVELGGKSEGIVPILQFGDKVPKEGDLIDVIVDKYDQASGLQMARLPGASQEADWGSVAKGMIVDAQIKKVNKGGLEVTVNGIRGFMPAGQVDLAHIADLSVFVGQTLRSQITEVSLSEKNLIVSRKAVLEQERAERARETLASLEEGQVREGVVKSIKDYGAFVDIGGVDGLLHIAQMSWHRVSHPADVVSPGQPVKVVVLGYDKDSGKISLGLRQLMESPWVKAVETYHVGSIVPARVTKLMEFGAFAEVEPGIEGLIHISELSPQRVHRIGTVVKVGQEVEVKVLEVDAEKQRMSLSLKQAIAQPEPEPEPVVESSAVEGKEEETAEPVKAKKPSGPLKGGLGGGGGPLFG